MAAIEGRVTMDGSGTFAVTPALAGFVAGLRWADVPAAVRREAKRALLNFFGTALGGCREPAIEIALRTLAPFSGPPTASLVGRPQRVDPLVAAFLNAAAANVFDFDDTHPATIIHPTAPVASALFAFAGQFGLPGEDLLLAFICGVEAECRIGNAVSPAHYRRGWHITSTCGVFGAAVAVAKAFALDQRRTAWAIGNAAVQTGGIVEALGTMSKSVGVGNAARNGLLAAMLAREGFSGPDRPLEGGRGFLHVATDAPRPSEVCEGLGERWELLSNTYKPYPCGVVLNPVLEACIALSRHPGLSLPHIERIEVIGHPLLRERTDRPGVRSGRESQVSAQHGVAAALARGKAGLAEFSDAAVADPALRELGGKVAFIDDERFAVDSARIAIRIRGRESLECFVEHAYGSERRPMTDADLEGKLRELVLHAGVAVDPEPLLAAVRSLEHAEDAARVMALACPEPAPGGQRP